MVSISSSQSSTPSIYINLISVPALSHSISSHRFREVQYRLPRDQGFFMVVLDFDIDDMNGAI